MGNPQDLWRKKPRIGNPVAQSGTVLPMSPINRDPHTGMNAAMADTLRAERAVKRLTLDELAAKSGIPKRTLVRLLDAERSLNIEHLVSLADALDLSLAVLMERAKARVEQGN